jgi:hypothetical protein
MKNIYKITKGQLIFLWIFGILSFFLSLSLASNGYFPENLLFITFLVIPSFIIFYTIGWVSYRKKQNQKENN